MDRTPRPIQQTQSSHVRQKPANAFWQKIFICKAIKGFGTPVIHDFKARARVGGEHSQAGAPVPLLVLLIALRPPHTAHGSGPSRPQPGSRLGSKSRHKLK